MFLKEFQFKPDLLPFSEKDISLLDQEVLHYEHAQLNPDVEKSLITQNEFLASFGISKAEDSTLSLAEAADVRKILETDASYDFIARKLKAKTPLTKKDYEKLEFLNIARVFKSINQSVLSPGDLTMDFIREIHARLTTGMDVFEKFLRGFTPYKSGKFRDNDLIRVDAYVPPSHRQIPGLVKQALGDFLDNPNTTTVSVLHMLLYAIHPFNNGNKRVCRILEHALLRMIGLNQNNLYSPSYYYHLEKERYYKYLLATLERKNLNYFAVFSQEALVSSLILVFKRGLEIKRDLFLNRYGLTEQNKTILKPLISRSELAFNDLYDKKTRKKMARQTFVNFLYQAVDNGILVRREQGRNVYYRLNFDATEQQRLIEWIAFARSKMDFVSDYVGVF